MAFSYQRALRRVMPKKNKKAFSYLDIGLIAWNLATRVEWIGEQDLSKAISK